jgi:hypothetical protein
MHFEHLVQVNDLNEPDDFFISRSQLWEGLLWRAKQPDVFLEGIESFVLAEERDQYLKRELHFPGFVVKDEVFLEHETQLRYEIIPDKNTLGASLTMKIEEPEKNVLFVRFIYQVKSLDEANSQISYDSVIQQAYINTDVSSIRLIKQRLIEQSAKNSSDLKINKLY